MESPEAFTEVFTPKRGPGRPRMDPQQRAENEREYHRRYYAKRIVEDEEFREKLRIIAREKYQRKKERLLEQGVELKGVGRPRKYT